MSTQTSSLNFSFEYTLVVIRRPWLVFNLLGTKSWSLGNLYKKGLISNGSKGNQEKEAMPLLPTAFVVARKIDISAHWDKSDWDYLQSQTHGGEASESARSALAVHMRALTQNLASLQVSPMGI